MDVIKVSTEEKEEAGIILLLNKHENYKCDEIDFRHAKGYTKFTDLTPHITLKQLPRREEINYRASEITRIVQSLLNATYGQSPVTVVFGLTSIGKSSIVKSALHFLSKRKYFTHAMILINLSSICTTFDLMVCLYNTIVQKLDAQQRRELEAKSTTKELMI